jgi:hypothetical protein
MVDGHVPVEAIHLYREGDDAVVAVRVAGRWTTVIVERLDGSFSHIIEASGMERVLARRREG